MAHVLSESKNLFEERCREYLQNYVPFLGSKCFVAGGIFQRLWHDKKPRDIDIYCDPDYFATAYKELEGVGCKRVVKATDFVRWKHPDGTIIEQIGFHNPRCMEYVLSFDFTVCMVAMDETRFVTGRKNEPELFLEHIDKKELHFGEHYKPNNGPNNILTRLNKYLKQGYTIENEDLTRILQCLLFTNPKKIKPMNYPG